MPNAIQVKSILNKTKSRDSWFLDDYTINAYSGCSFNCLYCYIRGSKYGTHMEEKLAVKENALEVLDRELFNRAKKGQYGVIAMSSATDPYLHFEKESEMTRRILELILKHRFPLHVITKSDLIIRDIDLLHQINERAILPVQLTGKLQQKVFISFSFSTVDDGIAKIFEPGATPPSIRLQTLKHIVKNGLLTGVSMMPLLPYISDTGEHLELMYSSFKDAGASYVFPSTITLFGNEKSDSKTLVVRAIEKHYPYLLDKYHRLFDNSDYLPAYYNTAFAKKAKELCEKYAIRDRIVFL